MTSPCHKLVQESDLFEAFRGQRPSYLRYWDPTGSVETYVDMSPPPDVISTRPTKTNPMCVCVCARVSVSVPLCVCACASPCLSR